MITVDPDAKLPGSTSVACWLVVFVNGSVLNFVSGTVAGGKLFPEPFEPLLELELEPQLDAENTAAMTIHRVITGFNFN